MTADKIIHFTVIFFPQIGFLIHIQKSKVSEIGVTILKDDRLVWVCSMPSVYFH